MTKEVMKDKIKKLLALAGNNPSDEESYSALQKAQALMAQYKIEENELSEDQREGCIKVKTSFSFSKNSSDGYLIDLAEIIADNFSCVHYMSSIRGSRTYYISFMGLESDVSVCVEAMTVANLAIIRGYNKVWRMMCKKYNMDYIPAKYFNPAKIGYIEGYLRGLKEVLESQKEQNQEWGLVLVPPKEATDYIGSLSATGDRGEKSLTYSESYMQEGYKDGKQFNLNKKLENKEVR